MGLLIGLQLYSDQSEFIQKLIDNNLLTIKAGENVIRILPPLTVKKKEVDLAIKIIKKSLQGIQNLMKHFINLKDIPASDLRKIISDARKRKKKRKNLNVLDVDKNNPLKGKLLIQMFEKSSLRTRLSFYLAIKQLGGGALTLRPNELHLKKGGESLADTAKILSTFGNAFMLRTDSDAKIR